MLCRSALIFWPTWPISTGFLKNLVTQVVSNDGNSDIAVETMIGMLAVTASAFSCRHTYRQPCVDTVAWFAAFSICREEKNARHWAQSSTT